MRLAYLSTHVPWGQVLKQTAREAIKDDTQSLAAQLAYYFFLALFPALICVTALIKLLPPQHLADGVANLLQPIVPAEALTIVQEQLTTAAKGDTALLSIGLLGALWSSSTAMGAMMRAMNRAYGIDDSRPWWKVQLVAVWLTIACALFILVSLGLVLAGPELADALSRRFGFAYAWAFAWKLAQWPMVLALVSTGVGIVYYFAPDAEQEWVWVTPGSVLAATLWLLGSLLFRYYVVSFGGYEAAYGAIGGIIVLLLWFFVTALIVVVGAQLTAEIEHASPWGKAPGQKRPGGRRIIGAAAERYYESRAAR